jgi:hypothetical protein
MSKPKKVYSVGNKKGNITLIEALNQVGPQDVIELEPGSYSWDTIENMVQGALTFRGNGESAEDTVIYGNICSEGFCSTVFEKVTLVTTIDKSILDYSDTAHVQFFNCIIKSDCEGTTPLIQLADSPGYFNNTYIQCPKNRPGLKVSGNEAVYALKGSLSNVLIVGEGTVHLHNTILRNWAHIKNHSTLQSDWPTSFESDDDTTFELSVSKYSKCLLEEINTAVKMDVSLKEHSTLSINKVNQEQGQTQVTVDGSSIPLLPDVETNLTIRKMNK